MILKSSSLGKPHSKDCLITIENEKYFSDSPEVIAV